MSPHVNGLGQDLTQELDQLASAQAAQAEVKYHQNVAEEAREARTSSCVRSAVASQCGFT